MNSTTKDAAVAVCEALHEEIVAQMVNDVGIYMIVAQIEFYCDHFSKRTFSTASTR
jgi:hypothetical protein